MNINDYNLWTALVTPLTPGLQVDFPSLEKLIAMQSQANNGLLVLGSTGEALNLSLEAKKSIVDFVLQLKPKAPLMIGIGGHDLMAQKEWLSWLETKNVHTYLMVTPLYAKPDDFGQYEWFKTLMDLSTKPVILYNVPGRCSKELSLKAVEKLQDHKYFWGIKEASGSVKKMSEYLKASNQKKVFCGDDALMPEFANAGSCGLISVASNPWPQQTSLYVEQCLNKTLKENSMWKDCANALFKASNPVPAKALMSMLGQISHDTVMPPLSQRDLKDKESLTRCSQRIDLWYAQTKQKK